MQRLASLVVLCLVLGSSATEVTGASRRALPTVGANPNLERAGVLRDGVLTIALVAKEGLWRLDGPGRPGMAIAAFAESGKSPVMPGPLVRAPQGARIDFDIRNELPVPLTFFVPAVMHGGPSGRRSFDSVVVAPATTGRLTTLAGSSGNYVYRAATPSRVRPAPMMSGALAGAIVIDSAAATSQSRDRVFVLMATMDSVLAAESQRHVVNLNAPGVGRIIFTINGRSWPSTERIAATVGDSVHWRILNASADEHPMHLHGFYYRVDQFSDPLLDPRRDGMERAGLARDAPGRMVVTQLLPPLATMSMTWSPVHPGNWIFHCHFALHLMPDSISAAPDDPHLRGMVGLVLGINVGGVGGGLAAGGPAPARRLRLLAISDRPPGNSDPSTVPSMRFVLEDHGRRVDAGPGFSPTIDLTRGERVSIMVVNQLDEPTSVHWHGIEVEDAYVDGVPGVSGAGRRLAPAIAPGDSFEARFTPPRSGTFMYHSHVDEVWQQTAGLEGALVVRDPGLMPSTDEHLFFIKGARHAIGAHRTTTSATDIIEISGAANPDTIVLHVGRPARLRFLSLATANPEPRLLLTARPDSAFELPNDTMIVQWRPISKDGFDLPASERTLRPAGQTISIGETYDFEYLPERPGFLRLEVRINPQFGGGLLARIPIRVQ